MSYQNQGKSIWIVCTGLGRINRGFESHASQLANLLADSILKEKIILLGGKKLTDVVGVKNSSIFCLHRNHWINKLFFKNFHSRFLLEQISFFISLIPSLIFTQPKLIYLGEYELYCYLFKFRKLFNLKYSLCLHTGGMAVPGLFNKKLDFIHHVTPYLKKYTQNYPVAHQFTIPHFLDTNFAVEDAKVKKIKELAKGKLIWLSVGSIDMHFKRMDLLCKILSPFSDKIFPIVLGESTSETLAIKELFSEGFGADGYFFGKVPRTELGNYYSAADAFILCTDIEPFGLVFLEAAYFGLPIFCNDNEIVRSILLSNAHYLNMNNLESAITYVGNSIEDKGIYVKDISITQQVEAKYGIHSLAQKYVDMFYCMYTFYDKN